MNSVDIYGSQICELLTFQSSLSDKMATDSFSLIKSILDDEPQSLPVWQIRRVVSESLEKALRNRSTTDVAVPLSVGLDSRFILGCLRDVVDVNNIHAFTAGQPGTYEFELSKFLYKRVVPNHRCIDLTNWLWDTERILDDLSTYPNAIVFNWPNFFKALGFPVMVHGYMGDTLAGTHLPNRPSRGSGEACAFFFNKFKTSIARRYNFDNPLVNCKLDTAYPCDFPDRIVDTAFDVAFRQVQRIRPHHMQQHGMFCPSEDKDVIRVFLNLSLEDQLGGRRCITECVSEFSALFNNFRIFRIKNISQYNTIRRVMLKFNNRYLTKLRTKDLTSRLYDWTSEIKVNSRLRSLLLGQLSDLTRQQIHLPWHLPTLKRSCIVEMKNL